MAEDNQESNAQMLQELQALSHSLYQSHTARRTASLALPRSAGPVPSTNDDHSSRPRSRRMSLSPWRSRPGSTTTAVVEAPPQPQPEKKKAPETAGEGKKGIWGWKPMRALSHIGMRRLACLLSVEVVSLQGLPASMNGLRLAVCVRKRETRDGAVQTMPSRVGQGMAEFEETLFVKSHVYYSGGGDKPLKLEPRPFLVYVAATDAEELDFGRSTVDLSLLVQESIEKNSQGARVRQWDTSFNLSGKARGGELLLKLGIQIMEDKGVGIYNQAGEQLKPGKSPNSTSQSFVRKQSKASFSVQSPRRFETSTPSKGEDSSGDLRAIDELDLNEPAVPPPVPQPQQLPEELDLPEFDVVDKGIEFQDEVEEAEEAVQEESPSASIEVVKEMIHNPEHQRRLTELDTIAQQIEALESIIQPENSIKAKEERKPGWLDAEEDTVTREFLQLLEDEEGEGDFKLNISDEPRLRSMSKDYNVKESEAKIFVPDLGKGLLSVLQTRDGGFLAAMNPFDVEVSRKETPKLAMQMSRPLVLPLGELSSGSGFELFQKMAGIGAEQLKSELREVATMDELMGKTADQIEFEGIASAIIQGRGQEEGASSSAARSVAVVKAMAAGLTAGRGERIASGIWNVREEPVTLEEILPFSLKKIETMVVEALKIQAEVAEEEAPFDISPLRGGEDPRKLITSAKPLEEHLRKATGEEVITILVMVQARDPLRRYDVVGAPVVALVQASPAMEYSSKEEERFKVSSLHVGGLRLKEGGAGEKQRLSAMQWVVAYGLGKTAGMAAGAVKKAGTKQAQGGKGPEALWSISARVLADMWLKPVRNPDVKFLK